MGMKTTILEPDEKQEVKYYSSISQHKNKLSVIQQHEYVPISYDSIDAITCRKGIISHREVVTDGDDIGFNFAVCECKYVNNEYITYDDYGVTKKKLPKWFGDGFYDDFTDTRSYLNTDAGSLGYADVVTLRIGTKYALANKTLKSDD